MQIRNTQYQIIALRPIILLSSIRKNDQTNLEMW
jgi:hypothetical protein